MFVWFFLACVLYTGYNWCYNLWAPFVPFILPGYITVFQAVGISGILSLGIYIVKK